MKKIIPALAAALLQGCATAPPQVVRTAADGTKLYAYTYEVSCNGSCGEAEGRRRGMNAAAQFCGSPDLVYVSGVNIRTAQGGWVQTNASGVGSRSDIKKLPSMNVSDFFFRCSPKPNSASGPEAHSASEQRTSR